MRSGRREASREYARASLWVLPGASLIVALVLGALLSRVQVSAHSSLHHLLFQGTEDDARNLLVGIMGAVITVIALTLGLTVVALQLSSTQFSPRLLRNFLRDRGTQVVLSVFIATFVYAAAGSFTVGVESGARTEDYPRLAVSGSIVLLFASLGMVVYYADHLAHSIQIDRLMGSIGTATIQVIKQEPPGVGPDSGPGPAPAPAGMGSDDPRTQAWLRADRPSRTAAPAGPQLEVTVLIAALVGEHVVAGRPIAYAWRTSLEQPPPDPAALAGPIQDAVVIGYQRTLQQNVRFGMRQLVDIALRALSPAVNDPYTAIQAIHRLTVLLCALGPLPLGDYQITGSTDASRVIVHAPAFADYAELACSLIRRYGAAEPTVSAALLSMPRCPGLRP